MSDTSSPAYPAASGGPLRASDPLPVFQRNLEPLAELAGTWVGNGFNVMSLPDFDSKAPSTGPSAFRIKLNATRELLQFTPIVGAVPNRGALTDLGNGTGQTDIELFGLTYLQRVSDAVSNAALHIEPGIWVNVPASNVQPVQGPTVVRMGSVPHGDSLLAQSTAVLTLDGGPKIAVADSRPVGPGVTPAYLSGFNNPVAPLPPGVDPAWVVDPNRALITAIDGQAITKTVVLAISTNPVGGIVNIPFVVSNANATRLDAVFWIETVEQPDGSSFMQLQYSQTVILHFLGIDWPHISVATLVKQ
ncbi:MAG TPA: heme-binding protein [Rhodopila sp.]|nr:heme-binding protein [Rhodopila sp.]